MSRGSRFKGDGKYDASKPKKAIKNIEMSTSRRVPVRINNEYKAKENLVGKERNRYKELNEKIEKQRKTSKYYERFYKNKWTDFDIERIADAMYEFFTKKEDYFVNIFFKDFLLDHGLISVKLNEFCRKNEYFHYMHTLCEEIQEMKLVKLGLKNSSVITMVIFTLKNKHKWRDRIESVVGVTDEELAALKSEAAKAMKEAI